jgi:DNA-binding response OmpR family regulator
MLSADATRPTIVNLLDSGAPDYLTKPLDVRHFLSRIAEILEERHGVAS